MARTSSLSLLVLLLASMVAAGVDLAERSGDTLVFSVPPPTGGARAIYGVTVLSDRTMNGTAPGALVVRVDGPESSDDPKGHEHDALLFSVERQPMPWDPQESVLAGGAGKAKAARHSAWSEETVRLHDGRVLVREQGILDERWRQRDGGEHRDAAYRHRMDHLPAQEGAWSAFHAHLGTTFAYRDPWVDRLDSDDPDEVPVTRALLDGAVVYGHARSHTHEARFGQGFGCHLSVPAYTYAEVGPSGTYAQKRVHSTATETVWVHPDHTFPLLVTCENTYRLDGPDGEILGTHRVLARLEEETRGEVAYQVGHHAGPLEPASNLRSLARGASGLPADPDPLFRFHLDDAYLTIVESDHEELAAFRDAIEPPFLVLSATYLPDVPDSTTCSLFEPLCFVDESGGPAPTARPSWTFRLQNAYGKQMEVRVERQVTAAGEGTPPEISATAALNQEAIPISLDEIPARLVAPSPILAEWLDHEDVDLERWRGDPEAYFTIHYEREDAQVVPHYALGGDFRDREPADPILDKGFDPEEWAGTFYHRYRGTDGILLDHGTDAKGLKPSPPPRPPTDPLVVYDSALRGAEHVPTLALVVGGLTLVAVATALRTGMPDWARRLLLLLPLFTKLTKDQVLEHKTRDEMIVFVAEHPGIGTEEIRRHFGIGWGTAVYHLAALEQNHLLSSIRSGGHRHWFPAKAMDAKTKEMLALLRSPAARRLYEAVLHQPGRTQQEIAEVLGVTHGAVIFQVRKLERAGLIRKERDGRFVRYHAEPAPSGPTRDTAPRTD